MPSLVAKLYFEYQCRNLHEYVTRCMRLSDDVAATYIRLARKSREVPALKEKIQNQSVSITNARLIAPVLTEANQWIWLEKAERLTQAKLERELAQEFPERAVREQVRYAAPERLELKLRISSELLEKLNRVQRVGDLTGLFRWGEPGFQGAPSEDIGTNALPERSVRPRQRAD